MLWTNTAFELAVLIPLMTGWQDYRTREASNLITIPYFFIGVGMGIYRYHEDHSMWYVFLVQGLITLITWFNGMGGADWKMQCGLFLFTIDGFSIGIGRRHMGSSPAFASWYAGEVSKIVGYGFILSLDISY